MDRGRTDRLKHRRARRPIGALLATATATSGLAIVATPVPVAFATQDITVTTTTYNPTDGSCSLPEAIELVNADGAAASDCEIDVVGAPDGFRIVFGLTGGAPYVIELPFSAPMQPITTPVDIDATTQPEFLISNTPVVVIDIGSGDPGPAFELTGSATGSIIRGFSIVNSDPPSTLTSIVATDDAQITDNYIGRYPDGTPDAAAGGIGIDVPAAGAGISGNVVDGRDVGIDVRGSNVELVDNVLVDNAVGISVSGATADDVLISENRVGTDDAGQIGLGNRIGIDVLGPEGPATLSGLRIVDNVISGNATGTDPAGHGVRILGAVDAPQILGNEIGTDAAGATAVPNDIGISIGVGGSSVPGDQVVGAVIGSPTAFEGNRISGNAGAAIVLGAGSRSTVVQGNRIGFDNDSGSLPNNTADAGSPQAIDVPAEGDIVVDGSSLNVIGGVGTNEANEILTVGAGSAVRVYAGVRNRIVGNLLRTASGIGIDLGSPGADANDPGDIDAPPEGAGLDDPAYANNLQNWPVIYETQFLGDILLVGLTLDSLDTVATYPVQLDIYVAGSGGTVLVATASIPTPGTTTAGVFDAPAYGIAAGSRIIATATDAVGNTSELSPAYTVSGPGTFVVNSTADLPDLVVGDGACGATGGVCTLRAAIQEANATPERDTVAFDFPGTGPVTFAPAGLPQISTPIFIDGLSAPGASCAAWPPALRVVLDTSNSSPGLFVTTGRLELRGVVVNGSPGGGVGDLVYLEGTSTGNQFRCNFFGTDVSGTEAVGQSFDQVFVNGSDGNTFGGFAGTNGNLFAGNSLRSHLFLPTSDDNFVVNNIFGTDVNGTAALGTANGPAIFTNGSDNDIGVVSEGAFGNLFAYRTSTAPVVEISGFGAPWPSGNQVRANTMFANAGIGIDIDDGTIATTGVTLNHQGVVAGPNEFQNFPVLTVAQVDEEGTRVTGWVDGQPGDEFVIDVYGNAECDSTFFGEGESWLGEVVVVAGPDGRASFDTLFGAVDGEPDGVTATATNLATDSTSEFSYCRPASTPNTNWVQAQNVGDGSTTSQYLVERGMEKWFRVPAGAGANVTVTLNGLPGSAVSIHTDPLEAYNAATKPTTAVQLAAEAADVAFLPSGSLPSGSLPSGSLPSGSLPSGSLPSGSLETGFLPSGSLPSGSLPSGSLPSGSLPSGSLPSGSLPSGSLPSGSLPSGSLPSGSLPSGSLPSGSLPSGSLPPGSLPSGSLPSGSLVAYSTASRRSLLAYSANPYALTQTISRNTFDYAGDVWVRVVGPYSTDEQFTLEVEVDGGVCGSLPAIAGAPVGAEPAAGVRTVILTDSSRLAGTPAEVAEALADLARFAARDDVDGEVVDLAGPAYGRVQSANAAADGLPNCAFAKNQVAEEIKAIVDAYRPNNPLQYVVIAGGADVVPFHQVSDVGGLANEREYVPPVAPNTPTDAGLRSGLVKGQDFYGSAVTLTVAGRPLAVPDLAVGRLVDGAADISLAIEAYEATDGVVTPSTSMVTGYDFVGDAAATIAEEFRDGIGTGQVSFVQPPGQPPTGADAWTANDIRPALLSGEQDVIMLTGHFSAGKLLAADYRTTILASEIQASSAGFADTIVLALGCHGGFSLPSTDLLDGASPDPDWAKAFLRSGAASFVAATGYAYGDTELEEYGERLFIELTREMRRGSGPIAMGEALVAAKQAYLEGVPQLSGLDEKTLVEMTLYGLPMMKIDVPGTRLPARTVPQIVGGTTPVGGATPGLRTSPATISPQIVSTETVVLDDLENGGTVATQYSIGRDGVVAVPFQPVLPKQIDGVEVGGQVLRGVALRGGSYQDVSSVVPFTSAPTTETSRPIQSFQSDVFVPTQVWSPNYYAAVDGRPTRLVTIPQQYRSDGVGSISGTLRTWSDVDLRLYYLPDDWHTGGDAVTEAGVSPAPSVTGASGDAEADTVTFSVNVAADGSAGVQAVWVLYTGEPGSPWYGQWRPVDLAPVALGGGLVDPTVWTGTLPLGGGDASGLRFMVQAVGGAGLTTLDTNLGAFYRVGVDNVPAGEVPPTTVSISAPASAVYGSPQVFTATVVQGGLPVPGAVVDFEIAGQRRSATASAGGVATVAFTPLGVPGTYEVTATVRGTSSSLGASAAQPLSLLRAPTTLEIAAPGTPQPATGVSGVTARLTSGELGGLGAKPVVFTLVSAAGTFERVILTDAWGTATLGDTGLPPGSYLVSAAFGGPGTAGVEDATFGPSTSGTVGLELIDTDTPTITATATVAGGAPYTADTWTASDVTITFACTTMGGAVLSSCTPPQTVTTEGITPEVVGQAVGGTGLTASVAFGPVKIDRTPPTITVTTPPSGASYQVGAVVSADFACVDAGVGGGSCVGTVADGLPIDTATPGTKTLRVTATDELGNTTLVDRTYTVAAISTAPVVVADMGVGGLQEIGFRGNAVLIAGSYTDSDGNGPYRATVQWSAGGVFTPFAIAGNGQFAAAFVYGSGGMRTVTIRICDRAGNCGTDTITVRAGISQKVTPVLQCVTDRGSGTFPRYRARFGYDNPAPFAIAAPTIPLLENWLLPLPAFRGQPQVFLPGSQRNVFTVDFQNGTSSWILHGKTVTARTSTNRC